MEPLIVDAAPKGSAILAYGRAKSSPFRRIAVVGVGAVAVAILACIVFAVMLRTVPLPPHRLITIAAVPASVARALSVETVSDLPPSWRAAVRSASKRPALFGIALREDGTPYPFAFVFGSVRSADGVRMERASFRTLLLDNADAEVERASTFRLFPLFMDLRHADAAWAIGANELRAFVGTTNLGAGPFDGEIRGRWSNGRGELDLSASPDDIVPPTDPFVVVLGGSASGSSIVKSAFIAQGVDLRDVGAPLAFASFSNDPFFVSAVFVGPLSPADASAASAAFGSLAVRDYALGDAGSAAELISATSTGDGAAVSFSTGQISASSSVFSDSSACGHNILFHLEGTILKNTLRAVGIPASLAEDLRIFTMAGDGERTVVCIE